ncbi:MAG: hypothetical protein H7A00_09695 [Hahellaceae bacterium]|nr:hypothetical protein [Hahellaceae bacterium]
MTTLDPNRIFPVLKPARWARDRELALLSLSQTVDSTGSVGVAFALDQDSNLTFFPPDALSNVSEAQLRDKAQSNLRRELQAAQWHRLSFDTQAPGLTILVLSKSFYAAEALLLADKLQEAHQQLAAKRLLACTPIRGQLSLLPYDQPNEEYIRVFIAGCLDRYDAALTDDCEDEALCPNVWIIEDGQVVGRLKAEQVAAFRAGPGSEKATGDANIKLFSYPQIVAGSFLGSVPCGFMMLGMNFWRLGLTKQVINVALLGSLITALFMYIVVSLPDTKFDKLFPLAGALLMGGIASMLQGRQLKQFRAKPYKRSFWAALAVIASSLLLLLVLFVALLSLGVIEK